MSPSITCDSCMCMCLVPMTDSEGLGSHLLPLMLCFWIRPHYNDIRSLHTQGQGLGKVGAGW